MAARTQKNKQTKRGQKNKQSSPPIFQGNKKLELVDAALLLTGRLKVDSVRLYTDSSLFVSLVGKF